MIIPSIGGMKNEMEKTDKEEIVNMDGFPARVIKTGSSYAITIPPDIIYRLKINHQDIVEIGIRKMDEEDEREKVWGGGRCNPTK